MRLRLTVGPLLLALSSVAQARETPGWCSMTVGYTHYLSDVFVVTHDGDQDLRQQHQRVAESFRTYLRNRGVSVEGMGAACGGFGGTVEQARASVDQYLEGLRRRSQFQGERTGWSPANPAPTWAPPQTQLTPAQRVATPIESAPRPAPVRRAAPPASSAGSRPGLYIGMPNETARQETAAQREAAQRAVAEENARQLQRARAAEAARQQAQAAHQARVAEHARAQAAHRAQLAESARQQQAYERARAEWEARSAACRAGNRDACVARVTPQ